MGKRSGKRTASGCPKGKVRSSRSGRCVTRKQIAYENQLRAMEGRTAADEPFYQGEYFPRRSGSKHPYGATMAVNEISAAPGPIGLTLEAGAKKGLSAEQVAAINKEHGLTAEGLIPTDNFDAANTKYLNFYPSAYDGGKCPDGLQVDSKNDGRCGRVCKDGETYNPYTGACTGPTATASSPTTFGNSVSVTSEGLHNLYKEKYMPFLQGRFPKHNFASTVCINPATENAMSHPSRCVRRCLPGQYRNLQTGRCKMYRTSSPAEIQNNYNWYTAGKF